MINPALLSLIVSGMLGTSLLIIARFQEPAPFLLPTVDCEEVAHELNNAFIDGQIPEAEARQIIERCFELYS